MTAFESRINVVNYTFGGLPDPQAPENLIGAEVQLTVASILPTPDGLVPIPFGNLSFGLNKTSAQDFIDQLQELVDVLVDPKPKSDIQIASSLAGVKEAQDRDRQLRSGN